MDKTQTAEDFCREVWQKYLVERQYGILGDLIAEDISVIGTGAHELSKNLKAFSSAITRESHEWNGRFIIKDQWYQTTELSDIYSLVIGELVVREDAEDGILYDMRFRFTVVLRWTETGWKVLHVHQSVPDPNQTSGEFFPHHIVERNERQVIYHLRHDAMTGLLNRLYLRETVNRYTMEEPTGVLMMMDIDKFKHMNDNYGHPFGDKVLTAFSQSLMAAFDKNPVGRIGGDEFVVYLPRTGTQEELEPYLAAFREDWRERQKPLKLPTEITASMGVSWFPRNGETYEALWKSADEALYRAKTSGKGQVCFQT